MSANKQQSNLTIHWADRCKEIFVKDDISPDERIEIETLCALAVELIRSASPYRLREAGRNVEIRYLAKRNDKKCTPI